MKRIALPLLCLLLTGCYMDQKQRMDACNLQAAGLGIVQSTENLGERSAALLEFCMRNGGYAFDAGSCPDRLQTSTLLNKTGTETASELELKIRQIGQLQKGAALCYRPMSWVGQQTLKLERAIGLAADKPY